MSNETRITVGSTTTTRAGGSQRISRRTLVKGAAWSVPVIAAATAVPAHAASGAVCPNITSPSVWGPFEVASGTPGGRSEDVKGNFFEFWSENGDTATTVAVIRKRAMISVQAGTTYTFTFQADMNYGNWDITKAVPSAIALVVNGTQIWQAQSRTGVLPVWPSPTSPHNYGTYTATFTATTTGTIPVDINFTMGTKPDPALANDDIRISTPTITCTPA
jgi:hypothetical protein